MLDTITEARPGSLDNVQNTSVTLRYIAPYGHTLEDVQQPKYFKNCLRECGQQRTPGKHAWNRIEIIAEDGTWEAELRIMSIGPDSVQTRLLREWRAPEKPAREAKVPAGYTIEMVRNNGWRAVGPGDAVVAEKLLTKAEAVKAAEEHAKQHKGDD